MDPKVDRIKRRFEAMRSEKAPWNTKYDVLARYILGRRNYVSSFQIDNPDDLEDPEIFDETARNALHLMASSNVGALWPNGASSFRLDPPFDMRNEFSETDELLTYLQFCSRQLAEVFDNPQTGFLTSLEEAEIEKGTFGIGGLFVEETEDPYIPVNFSTVHAKDVYVDVAPNGNIDTVYMVRWMTLRTIYKEYGPEALNDLEMQSLEQYSDEQRKYQIIIAIEPRDEYNPNSVSNRDFPYASCHVDITRCKKLRESGFKELPIFIGRFWHLLGEKYGRSPGMNALPSIREINKVREDLITAAEKMLFPPVNVIEGSVMGTDEVDLSPHGVNVVSVSGKMGNYSGRPIEQTIDVGDLQAAYARLSELVESIKNSFFIDRIMDLNNEQRMTLGETNIRNQLRGQSLNSIYARAEKEILEPSIVRTFNIMFERGLLGVVRGSRQEAELLSQGVEPFYVPDALRDRMVEGKEIYKIQFISPASRIRQSEEVMGIMETLQAAANLAQIDPTVLDGIDTDKGLRRIGELKGAPSVMLRSAEAIAKIRKGRQQQQQQMMEMEANKAAAATAKDVAAAQSQIEKGA